MVVVAAIVPRCRSARFVKPVASMIVAPSGDAMTMRAAYRWLYGQWLPASGYEPIGAGVVEEYLNNPRDTPPHALQTRISLALHAAPADDQA
jgi:hypothetical protein